METLRFMYDYLDLIGERGGGARRRSRGESNQ
jgi:hypothetical protein